MFGSEQKPQSGYTEEEIKQIEFDDDGWENPSDRPRLPVNPQVKVPDTTDNKPKTPDNSPPTITFEDGYQI